MSKSRCNAAALAGIAATLASAMPGCRELDPTQVLIQVEADPLATARGYSLSVDIWNQEGQLRLTGPRPLIGSNNPLVLPTTIPVVPQFKDSERTFRIRVELLDASGKAFNRYEGIGSFVRNQIIERSIVLIDPCNDVLCGDGLTCAEGVCQAIAPLPAPAVAAAVLEVGAGLRFASPCAALAAAVDGDVISIHAGTYAGEACVITQNGLTLRGVDGTPIIDAAGATVEEKALWLVRGNGTLIENVELRNATAPGNEGAAIWAEGKDLTLRGVTVRSSQVALFAADREDSNVLVERCEFDRNGGTVGNVHTLNVGRLRRFILRESWAHDGVVGHLVKARALDTLIETNRLTQQTGSGSYEIDLPVGGRAVVIGNVLQQDGNSQNPAMLAYGLEGFADSSRESNYLYVANNTFVTQTGGGIQSALIDSAMSGPVRFVNNVFAGTGNITFFPAAQLDANCTDPGPFRDEAQYDFRLNAGSACIDACIDASAGSPVPLRADRQYVHPRASEPRVAAGAVDCGAFELAPP